MKPSTVLEAPLKILLMTGNFRSLLATMLRTTLIKNSKTLEPAKIAWSTNWSMISFLPFSRANLNNPPRLRVSQLLSRKSSLNLNQSHSQRHSPHNLNNLKRKLTRRKNLK